MKKRMEDMKTQTLKHHKCGTRTAYRWSALSSSGLGVRGEEGPNQIGGGDAVAADGEARPHVVAALDGVEHDSRAILTLGIFVDVSFRGLFMLRRG